MGYRTSSSRITTREREMINLVYNGAIDIDIDTGIITHIGTIKWRKLNRYPEPVISPVPTDNPYSTVLVQYPPESICPRALRQPVMYACAHDLIWMYANQRYIPDTLKVAHRNGKMTDNRIRNLIIVQDLSTSMILSPNKLNKETMRYEGTFVPHTLEQIESLISDERNIIPIERIKIANLEHLAPVVSTNNTPVVDRIFDSESEIFQQFKLDNPDLATLADKTIKSYILYSDNPNAIEYRDKLNVKFKRKYEHKKNTPASRLSKTDIYDIRDAISSNESPKAIALRFGISREYVYKIANREVFTEI